MRSMKRGQATFLPAFVSRPRLRSIDMRLCRSTRKQQPAPIFLYESTVGQAAQTPRATNPANTRIAVTSARISFIVVTSFLHKALRVGYICAGVGKMGEGPERATES
jgi:hypothetical protein